MEKATCLGWAVGTESLWQVSLGFVIQLGSRDPRACVPSPVALL